MSLTLFETTLTGSELSKTELTERLTALKKDLSVEGADLVEVQFAKNNESAFIIIDANDEASATQAIERHNFNVTLTKEVRLIGEDLEDVKKKNSDVNYLVEWNLPEDLTMDQYLNRKKQNSVHYAEVPEVEFARTYVCEDMTKCLCFYDAPDEKAVKRARKAVKTPIDAITELGNNNEE